MTIPKFDQPQLVRIVEIVRAIKTFEEQGKNPHGPNVPNPNHVPLMLELRHGGPAERIPGQNWPVDPASEFPFHKKDRDIKLQEELTGAGILTKHKVLYPMTKAYIKQQWHRVYAFDVETKTVTEARLLVNEKQDPKYAERYKSAHEWAYAMRNDPELVYEEIFSAKELEEMGYKTK